MEEGGATHNDSAAIEEKQPSAGGGSSTAAVTSEHGAAATMVHCVMNMNEFQGHLVRGSKQLIVVDFSATWCGPCKMIKPFYHSLCEKYPDVIFLEVDVDDAQDVAAHCDVKCMPTFQFYKNNEKMHEFSGANKEKLEETIKKLK